MRSRKGHSKGCYRRRRDIHHSTTLLKTFWCTSTSSFPSPSEELLLSQQWGILLSSMLRSKFICTADIFNVINHFEVVIHKLIFNTYVPKAFFLHSIKVHHNKLFMCLLIFYLFYSIPTFMRYWPSFVPNKRTVPLVASSASVQTSIPGQKSIRFEKEQGECLTLIAEQIPLFTGVQITFQQFGEADYLSACNQILHPKTRNPNPKVCFLHILPLWTSWLIDYTFFYHLTIFSHLSCKQKLHSKNHTTFSLFSAVAVAKWILWTFSSWCAAVGLPEEKHQQERKGTDQALAVFPTEFVSPKVVTNQRLKNTFHFVFWRGCPNKPCTKFIESSLWPKGNIRTCSLTFENCRQHREPNWDTILHYLSANSTRREEEYLLAAWAWLKLEPVGE